MAIPDPPSPQETDSGEDFFDMDDAVQDSEDGDSSRDDEEVGEDESSDEAEEDVDDGEDSADEEYTDGEEHSSDDDLESGRGEQSETASVVDISPIGGEVDVSGSLGVDAGRIHDSPARSVEEETQHDVEFGFGSGSPDTSSGEEESETASVVAISPIGGGVDVSVSLGADAGRIHDSPARSVEEETQHDVELASLAMANLVPPSHQPASPSRLPKRFLSPQIDDPPAQRRRMISPDAGVDVSGPLGTDGGRLHYTSVHMVAEKAAEETGLYSSNPSTSAAVEENETASVMPTPGHNPIRLPKRFLSPQIDDPPAQRRRTISPEGGVKVSASLGTDGGQLHDASAHPANSEHQEEVSDMIELVSSTFGLMSDFTELAMGAARELEETGALASFSAREKAFGALHLSLKGNDNGPSQEKKIADLLGVNADIVLRAINASQ